MANNAASTSPNGEDVSVPQASVVAIKPGDRTIYDPRKMKEVMEIFDMGTLNRCDPREWDGIGIVDSKQLFRKLVALLNSKGYTKEENTIIVSLGCKLPHVVRIKNSLVRFRHKRWYTRVKNFFDECCCQKPALASGNEMMFAAPHFGVAAPFWSARTWLQTTEDPTLEGFFEQRFAPQIFLDEAGIERQKIQDMKFWNETVQYKDGRNVLPHENQWVEAYWRNKIKDDYGLPDANGNIFGTDEAQRNGKRPYSFADIEKWIETKVKYEDAMAAYNEDDDRRDGPQRGAGGGGPAPGLMQSENQLATISAFANLLSGWKPDAGQAGGSQQQQSLEDMVRNFKLVVQAVNPGSTTTPMLPAAGGAGAVTDESATETSAAAASLVPQNPLDPNSGAVQRVETQNKRKADNIAEPDAEAPLSPVKKHTLDVAAAKEKVMNDPDNVQAKKELKNKQAALDKAKRQKLKEMHYKSDLVKELYEAIEAQNKERAMTRYEFIKGLLPKDKVVTGKTLGLNAVQFDILSEWVNKDRNNPLIKFSDENEYPTIKVIDETYSLDEDVEMSEDGGNWA